MNRQIVVMSNCQTGGLHAALAAMLPDDVVTPIPWLGTEPEYLRHFLAYADVWISSLPRADSEALLAEVGGHAEIILVPVVLFLGFHPDLIHMRLPGGGELESGVGHYSSAIVAWGWLHGMGADEIVARFAPEVLDALGYTSSWSEAMVRADALFEAAEMDLGSWFLPLASRGPFMLTDNHPRVDALIALARVFARRLGADPELVRFGWEQVIPDGLLSTSVVWPVYPTVARSLGFPGAFVWRCTDGELIDLPTFVERSLGAYDAADIDPATVRVKRFERDPRCAAVLGTDTAELVAGDR